MEMIREILDTVGTPFLIMFFFIMFVSETKFQLRKRVQERTQRMLINFIVSLPSLALLRLALIPLMVWAATKNQTLHFGLNYLYSLNSQAEFVIAFVLLDCSNFIWHILNHKIAFLWRFHLVHHTDKDLDVTTAFRFHFGELIGSLFFRGTFVFLIGADAVTVLIYEIVFEAATQFHHSNVRLPYKLEKFLNKIIVTPKMHGIHHSIIRSETDSNFSVIFSFWDRMNRTLNLNVTQEKLIIGMPSYSNAKELTTGFLLKLPFTKIRKWSSALLKRENDN